MKGIAIALVLALAALIACGDDDPAPSPSSSGTFSASSSSGGTTTPGPVPKKTTVSSCDLTADLGYCLDFEVGAPDDEAANDCLGSNTTAGTNGVTNETTACPTASRVGSCVSTPESGVKTTYRYFSPKFTAASAEANCKDLSFGKFTP